ncbi:MAG: ABC transporter permease subunit [Lachnospiraceae bacterium]|jgi:hypothetical protein|nr:ABC transporter permease subunit [Lachnospiraceae bacterium]
MSGHFKTTQIKAEQIKARRRYVWAVTVVLCLVLFLWGTFNFRNADAADFARGYSRLFYQIPLLNTVLLPLGLAVIASRLCDWEIKGNTLKLLCTLQEKSSFYDCKLLMGLKHLFCIALLESVGILATGIHFHFTEKLRIDLLFFHFMEVFIVGAMVYLLQQSLSLLCENQLLPLAVGLVGSFAGLFSLFFPKQISRLVPWSYFCQFTPLAMDWDPETRIQTFYPIGFPTGLFLGFLVVTAGVYLIGKKLFLRKEY